MAGFVGLLVVWLAGLSRLGRDQTSHYIDGDSAQDQDVSERCSVPAQYSVGNLRRWIEAQGGTATGLDIGELPDFGGRGAVAATELFPGDVIIRIPLSLVINVEHVLIDKALGSLVDELGTARGGRVHEWLGDDDALAIFLNHEKQKGESSLYFPWLTILPSEPSLPNSPLSYTIQQLQLLNGTVLLPFIKAGQKRLDGLLNHLQKLPGFIGRPGSGAPFDGYTRQQHLWARTAVSSRIHAVRVRDRGGLWHTTRCIVPGADLFNTADDDALNVDCVTNSASTHFECVASRHAMPGMPLLAPYGNAHDLSPHDQAPRRRVTRLPNSVLLLEYGFTVDPLQRGWQENSSHLLFDEPVQLMLPGPLRALSAAVVAAAGDHQRPMLPRPLTALLPAIFLRTDRKQNSQNSFELLIPPAGTPLSTALRNLRAYLLAAGLDSLGSRRARQVLAMPDLLLMYAHADSLPTEEDWVAAAQRANLMADEEADRNATAYLVTAMVDRLDAIVESRLAEYPTSLEKDESALRLAHSVDNHGEDNGTEEGWGLPLRGVARDATRVVFGEKRAILSISARIKEELSRFLAIAEH